MLPYPRSKGHLIETSIFKDSTTFVPGKPN